MGSGLLKAFRPTAASTSSSSTAAPPPSGTTDEATLPDDLLKDVRDGGVGKSNDNSRSALFQSVISQLRRRHWSIEAIIELLEKYPNGVAAKYGKRLRREVARSYGKATAGAEELPRRQARLLPLVGLRQRLERRQLHSPGERSALRISYRPSGL